MWFLTSVSQNVLSKRISYSGWIVTLCALVWFLPIMREGVSLQMTIFGEWLVALCTSLLVDSIVNLFMFPKAPSACKCLRTPPLLTVCVFEEGDRWEPEVCKSHFFNLETRMRISPTQSHTSRQDRGFLTLNLTLRDETELKCPTILSIETRLRFIINILRLWDEIENSLDLILVFDLLRYTLMLIM